MLGISVVIPVLDDRRGLEELLDALGAQTRPPEEVVIVDGGSTDGTRELAESWREPDLHIRLMCLPDVNIAGARNAGIEAASQPWIASTDAGCRPAPGWLEAIACARGRADFVAGVVLIEGDTPLQRILRYTHYPSREELSGPPLWVRISHRLFGRRYDPDRVGGGYMAFEKSVWAAVGGFPEQLDAAEDRGFSTAVARAGFRMVRAADAVVAWSPPDTWTGNARMFIRYSRRDVRLAGRGRHFGRAAAWATAAETLIAGGRRQQLVLALASLGYLALPLRRSVGARVPPHEWWRIPLVIALKDISQLIGAALGTVDAVCDK
jgi:glycosyltransferase involved in cell wall biosynthesis